MGSIKSICGIDSIHQVTKLWNRVRRGELSTQGLESYPVVILSNTTQDFFIPYLYAAGFSCGLDLKITWSGFDRCVEMATNLHSLLYSAEPKAIFLNYNQESKLAHAYYKTFVREERLRAATEFIQEIAFVVYNILKNLPATKVIIHTVYWFHSPVLGYLDAVQPDGPSDISDYINNELRDLAIANNNVYLLGMQQIVGQIGFMNWRDNNRWFSERVETINGNAMLAREYLKFIKSFTRRNRKVIVLDLDNTLWGGLAGEDGLSGIKLNNSYPGNVYKQFQFVLKLYSQRGILLALNSKNNYDDAMTIIRNHPEMVLHEDDFVAIEINWNDKVANMINIAKHLNLNLNSFVFIDDSPQERNLVRHALPEILVPEFPSQIADLPYILDELNDLDCESFTETDKQRTQLYKTDSLRLELKKEAMNIDDYLAMLKMQVTITLAEEADLGRLEQLFQRTNQFNLTAKCYTLNELRFFSRSPSHALVVARMKDTFGEFGIIATALLEFGEKARIDSFLMSCRVIGKNVETIILSYFVKLALKHKHNALFGEFVPTKKNEPSRMVYPNHGFERRGNIENIDLFVLQNLTDSLISVPDYITVEEQYLD